MDYTQVLHSESAKEFRLPKNVTEDNWKSRMSFCSNLTDTINSHGSEGLPKDFHVQIEPYLNNILECALSERTQLSNAACRLLERLPEVLERDMHPHLDRILPVLIKLCANTKQVTVKVAAAAAASIIKHSTYSPRLLFHACDVFDQKPAGPKIYGTEWLQTILKQYHRHIDLNKDGRMVCKAILLALEDADATVRTKSRATYWTYSRLDPDGAHEIMDKLDQHKKTALLSDPSNPDKKAVGTKKEPPRPRSALADVRKEQAKKKRAEEEAQKQKKTLNTSTASHDNIEALEPKKEKPKKDERTQVTKAVSTDRTVDGWQPALKSNINPPAAHKKTLSQDHEVAKPSASSRLLAAPVRRPKYAITPMAAPQISRPSSRTGHATTHKEKDAQKESRPTSSSSWKSASVGPGTVTSPKSKPASTTSNTPPRLVPSNRRPIVAPTGASITTSPPKRPTQDSSSPGSKSIPSRARAPYVAEGKENAIAHLFANTKPVQGDDHGELIEEPPIDWQKPGPGMDIPEVRNEFGHTELYKQQKPPRPSPPLKGPTLIDRTQLEHRVSASDAEMTAQWKNGAVLPREMGFFKPPMDEYPERPLTPLTEVPHIPVREVRADLKQARRFVAQNLPNFRRNRLDVLMLRKLKNYVESHPEDLIDDAGTYNQLFENLCYAISKADDLGDDENQRRTLYSRTLVLQLTRMLLEKYPAYAWPFWSTWIKCMMWYRCILDTDNANRQVRYLFENINFCINQHPEPLSLIDSVMAAIKEGESILLKAVHDEETATQSACEQEDLAFDSIDSNRELPTTTTEASLDEHSSWNPYSIRSHMKVMAEITASIYDVENAKHMRGYMIKALNEHNIKTIDHERPYPRALPQLIATSLEALTDILIRANILANTLDKADETRLLEFAEYCLGQYDYMIKKPVIGYVKALYSIMEDQNTFWAYFENENETENGQQNKEEKAKRQTYRNLLEYYIHTSRR
ncbi:suppressor of tub2 mutation [Lithohypha guttulata]|uniref:Suppressor of tub2 mutation n=1 Tax=Lithohypha guttulata TaxID=1690604 RepID=A0AAN7T109_9EURO|nr:suppressor of tub2 mutation [Lithohypha guttulata]